MTKNKKQILKRATSIFAIATLLAVSIPMQTTRATGQDALQKIWDKAAARQLYWCYQDGGSMRTITNEAYINQNGTAAFTESTDKATRRLPALLQGYDAAISCQGLIDNITNRKGINASGAELAKLLGYEEDASLKTDATGTGYKYTGNSMTAVKNIFGYSDISDMRLTEGQIAVLYQSYLEDYYGLEPDCSSSAKASGSSVKVRVYDSNGKAKTCVVDTSKATRSGEVPGLQDGSDFFMHDKTVGLDDIIKKLNSLTADKITENQQEALDDLDKSSENYGGSGGGGLVNTNVGDSNTKAVEGEDDPCFGLSGALGWMFCPIVNALGDALSTVYDAWIEPMLATSPGVLQAMQVDGGNGIYTAWGLFRDIANIVFVILLLVVIFSQVTGFGIDNYGIKRMLPRLIIAAVLVNFSFIICQLAVDISNILGSSLKDLFISFGKEVSMASGNDPATIGDFISVILAGLGILGIATAVFAYGSQTNWAFLLSIGVTLLVAVIAVLFGFFLLGVRQAAVVLLVVTSPLAFVLYMLPNTYRYFQQWLRLFLRMLLVYPACGLMIGAGYFSARIILSVDDGLVFNLIGLILLVAPYFLIIPLVRTSMNAINGLGGKIQAIGSGMQRGANSAIRGSETYKNLNTQIRGARAPKRVQDLQKRMNSRTKTTGLRGAINRIPGMSAVNKARNEADMAMVSSQIGSLGQQDIETMKNMQKMDEVAHPGESAREILDRMNAEVTGNTKNDQLQRQAMLTRVADMGGQKEIAKWAREEIENSNFNLDDQQMDTLADFLGKDGKSMAEFKKIAPSMANYLNQRGRVNGQRVSMLDENGQVRGAFHEKYDKDVDIASLDEKGFAFAVAHDGLTAQRIVESGAFGPNASQAARQATREGTRKMADLFTGAAANSNTMAQHVINSYSAGNTNPGNVMGSVTRSDGTAEARRIESLTLAGGLNVVGQSGALSGYMPNTSDDSDGLSGFNATKAYKATSGEVIMEDDNGRKWDATNGRNVSGQSFDIQTNFNSADSTPSSSTGAPTFEDGGGI